MLNLIIILIINNNININNNANNDIDVTDKKLELKGIIVGIRVIISDFRK